MTKPRLMAERVAELEGRIRIANRLYYDDPDNAQTSDAEFDGWVAELRQLCPNSAVLNERSNFDRDITHTRLVGSWDKCHTVEEVVKHFGTTDGGLLLTPKIDGASLTLYYEDGRLSLAATRGDSQTGKGKDITANALHVEGIPWFIDIMGQVEVKGEAYIPKSEFYGVMDQPGFAGKPNGLANPRNAAAGGLMAKNPMETAQRKLHFVAYGLEHAYTSGLHANRLLELGNFGFDVPHFEYVPSGALTEMISAAIKDVGNKDAYDFEIDGVVLILDSVDEFEKRGVSGICPQGGLAYKFDTEKVTTTLLDIEWRALRTGKVRPKGRVDPVVISGSTIEFLTLNNITWLLDQDVCVGDTIVIEKANEIIPKLVSVTNRVPVREINRPTECPSCGREISIVGADLICPNKECPAKVTEATLHIMRKLDVKGIGPEFIDRMADGGLLEVPADVWKLTTQKLIDIGFGPGQAANIIAALTGLSVSGAQQLAALGIRWWGTRLFTLLFRDSTITYYDLIQWPLPEDLERRLAAVPQIGPARAKALVDGLARQQELLKAILDATSLAEDKLPEAKEANGHPFFGKTFCVTGKLNMGSRGDVHRMITVCGGTPVDRVNKDTDFLVMADPNSASSKAEKARKLGTKLLSEAEFYRLCESA